MPGSCQPIITSTVAAGPWWFEIEDAVMIPYGTGVKHKICVLVPSAV